MDEKSMQFANFNITFGENDAPMLKHFSDIIFPAFSGDYIRGKRDSVPRYFFAGVEIKEVDNEYVMVGNFIKETQYKVVTTVQEGVLASTPADVPTAPYSRFIVFLKNHRMVLVRNETASPDTRSFQSTVRDIFKPIRPKCQSGEIRTRQIADSNCQYRRYSIEGQYCRCLEECQQGELV